MTTTVDEAHQGPIASDRQRALVAGCLGNLVEWYDFAIYGASATVLAAVLMPAGSDGLIIVFAIFSVSLALRPLGALAVGTRADRHGRRRLLAATILSMTVATAAIGLVPTWSVVGALAPIALIAFRGVQSFASGGEITTSVTYLAEYAPPGRRGWFGGWHLCTLALGVASGVSAVAVLGWALSPQQLSSWGWRVPFLLALPLGLVGWYLRYRLGETPDYVAVRRNASVEATPSVLTVWRGHRSEVLRGFVVVAALACPFNVWFVFVPSYLVVSGRASLSLSLGCAVAGLLVAAAGAPMLGRLSDRVGRRPVLLGAAVALCVACPVAFASVRSDVDGLALLGSNLVIGALLAAFVLSSFVPELFPVSSRATGVGLSYGLATAVVGGTAPLAAASMNGAGFGAAIPLYVALWGIAAIVTVARAPETAPLRGAVPLS